MKAQNRHDTARWKKRRKDHGADKCGNAKCGICHPHKAVGGNHNGRVKAKYESSFRRTSQDIHDEYQEMQHQSMNILNNGID